MIYVCVLGFVFNSDVGLLCIMFLMIVFCLECWLILASGWCLFSWFDLVCYSVLFGLV